MTANVGGESAKIYTFPKGGRAGLRADAGAVKPQAQAAVPVVCEDAWYHEAAMREETPRKQ